MKQTAVEWLIEEMSRVYIFDQTDFDLFKQAKKMEWQQLIDTWYDCKMSIIVKEPTTADEYYDKTFENKYYTNYTKTLKNK
jgi:hypothetical protein